MTLLPAFGKTLLSDWFHCVSGTAAMGGESVVVPVADTISVKIPSHCLFSVDPAETSNVLIGNNPLCAWIILGAESNGYGYDTQIRNRTRIVMYQNTSDPEDESLEDLFEDSEDQGKIIKQQRDIAILRYNRVAMPGSLWQYPFMVGTRYSVFAGALISDGVMSERDIIAHEQFLDEFLSEITLLNLAGRNRLPEPCAAYFKQYMTLTNQRVNAGGFLSIAVPQGYYCTVGSAQQGGSNAAAISFEPGKNTFSTLDTAAIYLVAKGPFDLEADRSDIIAVARELNVFDESPVFPVCELNSGWVIAQRWEQDGTADTLQNFRYNFALRYGRKLCFLQAIISFPRLKLNISQTEKEFVNRLVYKWLSSVEIEGFGPLTQGDGAPAEAKLAPPAARSKPANEGGTQGFLIERGVLTNYLGSDPDIAVPDTVTKIDMSAFSDKRGVVLSVVIPGSVKTIPERLFSNHVKLESVAFEKGVTTFGKETFKGCTGLRSVVLPEGVKVIPNYMFKDCESLESIVIPQSVAEIGMYAFENCKSLKEIAFPAKMKEINICAFSGCESLNGRVTLPKGLSIIESSVFRNCTHLVEAVLPNEVEIIYSHAFSGCSRLVRINMPKRIRLIGACAFDMCKKLEPFEAPAGAVVEGFALPWMDYDNDDEPFRIEGGVLRSYLGNAQSVVVPMGVTEIGSYAFSKASRLEKVIFSEGVRKIGAGVFTGLTKLEEIVFNDGITDIDGAGYGKSLKLITIPESVQNISPYTFYGASKKLVIRAKPGSFAAAFAKKNKLKLELM